MLLVPRVLSKLSQQVDVASLQLALQFAHEANNPFFRLAFNSLGAYGTVNHLHFQVWPDSKILNKLMGQDGMAAVVTRIRFLRNVFSCADEIVCFTSCTSIFVWRRPGIHF